MKDIRMKTCDFKMKRTAVFFLLMMFAVSSFAQRTGKMMIQGSECEYDTLVHRHIAPGVTLTQYQFPKIPIAKQVYKMKAHLITVDMTNKYNSFTPYLSKGQHFAISTQKQEVKRQKELGLKPIATMTGGGFNQSNGDVTTATAYEVTGSLVTKGEVKYQNSGSRVNFYVDADRTMHVGSTKLSGSVTSNGKSFTIDQVNHHRDKADGSQLITLFCNGVPRSNAAPTKRDKGVDVRVKLVDAKCVASGKETKCKVTEILNGCYHTLASDEAILSGTGNAETYLRTLSVGDEVSIKLDFVDASGKTIDVQEQLTNLFGYCIKDGEVQEYSTKNYAICAIGYSEDGKTCYWADLEISTNSNAPCICLADLLKATGAYNAMWLDGGPSAEMTVDGEFITTNSIGYGFNGRYIPAGFILYSEAPDDNTISTIELANPSKQTVYPNQTIKPTAYGYNQYGEMITSNACQNADVEMYCTEGIGTVTNGVFTAAKPGEGYIYIKVKSSGAVVSIPVEVIRNRRLNIEPKYLFTGEARQCQVKLSVTEDGVKTSIDPANAEWSQNGFRTVKSSTAGLIVPYADGRTNVYAQYEDLRDTMTVVVENLVELVDSIDYTTEIDDPTYPEIQLRSVPHYFQARISGTPETQATLYYVTGTTPRSQTIDIPASGNALMTVVLDYDSVSTYPVIVDYVTGTDEEGREYDVTSLVSFYKEHTAINDITTHDASLTLFDNAGKLAVRNGSDRQKRGTIRLYQPDGAMMGEYRFVVAPYSETVVCDFPKYPFVTKIIDK